MDQGFEQPQRDALGRFVKGHKGYRNSGNFKKGHTPWNKGLRGIHISPKTEFKKGHIPHNKGKPHPYGHRWKKGKHPSPRTEIKKGQHLSPSTEFTSEKMKKLFDTPEKKARMIRKLMQAMRKKPTKPEKKFMHFIEKHSIPLEYVGDGKFFIMEFNPDFVNKNMKIVVEVFGDYWHNLPQVKKRDARKLKIFEQNGWQMIIIWEHELKNENMIWEKLSPCFNYYLGNKPREQVVVGD